MPSPLAKVWLASLKLNHRSCVIRFARLERIHPDALKISVLPENCRNQLPPAGRMCSAQGTGSSGTPPCPLTPNPLAVLWCLPLLKWMSRSVHTHCSSIIPFRYCHSSRITSKFWDQPENINAAFFPGHIPNHGNTWHLIQQLRSLTCLLQPSYHRCCQ